MWQIIKAELGYNRKYFPSAFVATIAMWFAYVFDPAGMFQLFGVPAFFLMPALFHLRRIHSWNSFRSQLRQKSVPVDRQYRAVDRSIRWDIAFLFI